MKTTSTIVLIVLCTLLVFAGASLAAQTVLDFDTAEVGKLPADFSTALTGGGGPVTWVMKEEPSAPSGGKVLAQTSTDTTNYRFPLCVYDNVTAKDVEVSVKFKPVSGKVDQAAGIVWRYQDKDNYYIVRANALEDNVVLYKVENGKRTDLKPIGLGCLPTGRKQTCPVGSGVNSASRPKGTTLRFLSTAKVCLRWKTKPLQNRERWASGRKRIVSPYFDNLTIESQDDGRMDNGAMSEARQPRTKTCNGSPSRR